MTPDWTPARDFLRVLSRDALPGVTFQTFDDLEERKSSSLARILHGANARNRERLESLQQRGAGVFVAVNEMDGQGRSKAHAVAARAVWSDIDDGKRELDEILSACPIPPSAINESSPGKWHLYWWADGLSLEECEAVNTTIAEVLDTDRAVKDYSRVMRLPGTWHLKNPQEPFHVRVVELTSTTYQREELLEAFPPAEESAPATPWSPPRLAGQNEVYVAAALESACERIASAAEGERNNVLFKESVPIFELCAGAELDYGEAEGALGRAGVAAGLKEREVRLALESARKKGTTPRRVPEKGKDEPLPADILPFTDLGNSERFLKRHGEEVRFWSQRGKWLVWDERRWRVDKTDSIAEMAKDTVRAIAEEAKRDGLKTKQKNAIRTWAKTSQNITRLGAMTRLSRSARPVVTSQLDQDPWALTCNNGTLDLQTGKLRAHCPDDLVTKLAPVDFDEDAECPRWLAFLEQIMGGDHDLITYLQRAIGYSLTGLTTEQCMFFLYGTGANGKSTFLNTVQAMLGDDFTRQMDFGDLDAGNVDQHPARFAKLVGARWVVATESEQGRRLAEVIVKQLTGGDRLSARFMRQDFFEFTPQFKLWLASNYKPIIRGTDEGIWRRIKLVPFTVTIPEAERDGELGDKLLEELPGIFAWAVQGCLAWQREGLAAPGAVSKATASYRGEMDILQGFLSECCIVREDVRCGSKDLYEAYRKWCEASGEKAFGQRKLGLLLQDRGFARFRTKRMRGWEGLGLASDRWSEEDTKDNVTKLF